MTRKANHQTDRHQIRDLQQIVNIGPSTAEDLKRIGIRKPQQLIGKNPLELYKKICERSGEFNDPCVLDVMISSVEYMEGKRPRKWWDYTKRRKAKYARSIEELRNKFDLLASL